MTIYVLVNDHGEMGRGFRSFEAAQISLKRRQRIDKTFRIEPIFLEVD